MFCNHGSLALYENAADVAGKLAERKIIVSARWERVRVSVHVFNNEGDFDRLIDEFGKIMEQGE